AVGAFGVEGVPLLPCNRLVHVLLAHFGPQCLKVAQKVCGQLLEPILRGKAARAASADEEVQAHPLTLQEVVLWARRVRDCTLATWEEQFKKYDKDGSGTMDMAELQSLIQDTGFTVLEE
ncbi:unnamed protein product, partial [Prorocentrum cordatum]